MTPRHMFVTIVGVAFVGSLALAAKDGPRSVLSGEVAADAPAAFKPLFEGAVDGSAWAGFPYERIELERTPCFGDCPVYRVTFLRGGRAELHARNWRERSGAFVGTVNIVDYGKLCYLLRHVRFDDMVPSYLATWTDAPTAIVTAIGGGRTLRVSDYGPAGPIELWGVQQVIDAIASDIRWTPQ